jgi:hypothetical protein
VSGSTIHKQVKDSESLIHDSDADRRSKSGSESHWERCARMYQRDTADLRDKFITLKTMAMNKDIYALWLAVMLGFKTLEDCSPDSSVTVDADGKVTAAVVKGPRRTAEQVKAAEDKAADKARKVLGLSADNVPEQTPAAVHPALADLLTGDAAAVDAICDRYATLLGSMDKGMWDMMSLAFTAGIMQRDRIVAPADPIAAAVAAAAAAAAAVTA